MIVDNRPHKRDELKRTKFDNNQWELLRDKLSHRSVRKLCEDEKNSSLLIFPHCLNDNRTEFCEAHICEIVGDTLTTGNLMGYVGVEDDKTSVELTIRSRFQKEGEEDYFLHYLLDKVFHLNILNLPTSGGNNEVFEFILFHLFTHYLKKAVKQGLFKQYRKCQYNDANVRGVIDIPRHIRYNMPFNGKVAYRTSEYKYDNPVTQLIRHTIEYIRSNSLAGNVLKCDKNTSDAVRTIYDITASYNANDRQRVISQNLKPVKHPFYTQYTFLQRLCLHILRHKKMSYSHSQNKVYGILFDGAWLWEEYLATLLVDKGFIHAVKGKEGGFALFKGKYANRRYPDFYNLSNSIKIVLDAKYKRLNAGIQRNDLYQMISYIHTLNDGTNSDSRGADYGLFVYPYSEGCGEDKNKSFSIKKLFGYGGHLGVVPVVIPVANNYQSFCSAMESSEETMCKRCCENELVNFNTMDSEEDIELQD